MKDVLFDFLFPARLSRSSRGNYHRGWYKLHNPWLTETGMLWWRDGGVAQSVQLHHCRILCRDPNLYARTSASILPWAIMPFFNMSLRSCSGKRGILEQGKLAAVTDSHAVFTWCKTVPYICPSNRNAKGHPISSLGLCIVSFRFATRYIAFLVKVPQPRANV